MDINLNEVKMLATEAHKSQRYGNFPYTYHLEKVEEVLKRFISINDYFYHELIIVGWLHDILEDTPTTYQEIENKFGIFITECVYAVTDEKGSNRKERKSKTYPKISNNRFSLIVKLADRIANIEACIKHDENLLFIMYKKEFKDFQANLYEQKILVSSLDHIIDKMWVNLDSLLEN